MAGITSVLRGLRGLVDYNRRKSLPEIQEEGCHHHGYHETGLCPHWIGNSARSVTHHPVDPVKFYTGTDVQIDLDVSQFCPADLLVRLSEDALIVEGDHEERCEDHGTVKREFLRRFALPPHLRQKAVVANLTATGNGYRF
ncbi:unnamed protein product [Anisakis simplex]|uniref:SHSP domain-containing protein n=1 Tax=Anisakis simplex TaxID=6269 RepID=A0A0M3KG90_ANISI|nr:unnamed protein product [Anisakis simplex]